MKLRSAGSMYLAADGSTRINATEINEVLGAEASVHAILPRIELQKGSSPIDGLVLVSLERPAEREAMMERLTELASVEYVEPERYYSLDFIPNDSAYAEQWGMKRIGMETAWEVTQGSPDITIGVIDTGIDYLHEDLRTQLRVNTPEDANANGLFDPWPASELRDGVPGDLDGIDNDGNGFIDDVIGYDFVDQPGVSNSGGGDYRDLDPDPLDGFGHGSSVSGIIAAATNNSKGIAGIAPNCRILTMRAFDDRGLGTEGDVARSMVYAVANGVDIINMSFGDVVYSRVLRDVVKYAYGRGVVLVGSAGNSGVNVLHYPSAYDEVISVTGSTSNDFLAGYNFGQTIDITAPGLGVPATNKDGGYTSFSGTSAAAPFVAGVAALVKSLHPEFTPEEVRGVLIASAEDQGSTGWDERWGAGLLRADRAVDVESPTVVRILSPKTDFSTNADSLVITGTAASPLMNGYRLDIGVGHDPDEWTVITGPVAGQAIQQQLAVLDLSVLTDTTYTIRLAAVSDKGISLDDRVVIHVDRSPPVILGTPGFIPAMNGKYHGVGVGILTDEPTVARVYFKQKNVSEPWQSVSIESASKNNLFVANAHYMFLDEQYLKPGNTYEFYMEAEDQLGLKTVADAGGKNFELTIAQPVPEFGFSQKLYSLPRSRMAGFTSDFNGNTLPELLINDQEAGNRFRAYEFNGAGLSDRAVAGVGTNIPRGVGDANQNGKQELLASFVRQGYIYEAASQGEAPSQLLWADSVSRSFWPITIADVNDDGRDEVLAVIDDSTIGIYTLTAGNTLNEVGRIINPTPAPRRNVFDSPSVAVGDFNGNNQTDLLFGDQDGDFFIVESLGGGAYSTIWQLVSDFEAAGSFVTRGDFTGNGLDEFAIGFRTTDSDVIPFWVFGIYRLTPQNQSVELWSQAYYGVETGSQLGLFAEIDNSIAAGNLDDDLADELVITVYPELYVVELDEQQAKVEQTFFLPLVNTNAIAIADFDGNGIGEMAFNTADSIRFFEKEVPYTGPPPPRDLWAEYLTPGELQLSWTAASASPAYRIYRGADAGSMTLVHTSSDRSYIDNTIAAGERYLYAIAAYDQNRTPSESPRLYTRLFRPHAAPVLDSAVYLQQNQVRLYASEDLGNVIPSIDKFLLQIDGKSFLPVSVALADRYSFLLSFPALSEGEARITVPGLRDGEGILFANETQASVQIRNVVDNELYIVRVEYVGGRTICVYFNVPVDKATAEDITNYHFRPNGQIISAVRDPENPRKVCLTIGEGIAIGAVGKEYTLQVTGILSEAGIPIVTGAGSSAGLVFNRDSLDEMFVYPNPLKPADEQDFITFANLTQEAEIRIYTVSGTFVGEVVETDGNGGVEWNLIDENGNRVPPGIYIYYATGTNGSGAEVPAVTGKFAIVR
ncbi:MAG: hypothetical protein CL946_03680 [Ectothiorhodospiraceae bacterium]|nr:hypothetical protein [Ectothiorhodospiraceae bacterium]